MRQDDRSPVRARRGATRRRSALALASTVLAASVAVAPASVPTAAAAHPTYVNDEIIVPGARSSYGSDISENGDIAVVGDFNEVSRVYSWNDAHGLVDIGDLGGGHLFTRDINATGQIIGLANVVPDASPDHSFSWTRAGGIEDLGGLNGAGAFAEAVNDAGVVVGGSGGTSFRWTSPGGMVDIGVPYHGTYAVDVNNAGAIAILDQIDGRSYSRAADGTLTDIGDLGGGATRATAMNDNGMIVGSSQTAAGDTHPFAWTAATGMVDLAGTSLVPVGWGEATDVNDSGQVAGRSELTNGTAPAFYWSASEGFVVIDGLGTTTRETEADSINEVGQVVGYSYDAANRERGFVWTVADGILELDLRDAYEINDDGVIAGVMRDLDGTNTRAARVREFVPPPAPDANGNGVDDAIEVAGPPLGFDDGDGTLGSVTDANGYTVTVTDAPDPGDGVRIVVSGPGSGKALFSVCGFTLKLSSASDVVVTCGSIIVAVSQGEAQVESADGDVVVTVPAGASAEVQDRPEGGLDVTNLGTVLITIAVSGVPTQLGSGGTGSYGAGDTTPPSMVCAAAPTFLLHQPSATMAATVDDAGSGPAATSATAAADTSRVGTFTATVSGYDLAGNATTVPCPYAVTYRFVGLAAPVDNLPTVNAAKAGQTIPVKWQVTDFHGVGVADQTSFVSVTTSSGACSAAAPFDAVETYSGGSGLQYLGNGSWQFNWKAPKSYAGLCRTLHLGLADSTAHVAAFSFK